uniref:Uncharacterized protein n=1 Tax=Setaria digitata TaxID=48799 RepID=A0A915PG94_9BILA
MALVTFFVAVAAITAFYFYSTKPACREVVKNWSISKHDGVKEVTPSEAIKERKQETPAEALPAGAVGSQTSSRPRDDEEKTATVPDGDAQTGTALDPPIFLNKDSGQPSPLPSGATAVEGKPEEGGVTGNVKQKKKKKSKNKKSSKRKKGSKRSKKEGKKTEETLPDDQ